MSKIYLRKLLAPQTASLVARPRLLAGETERGVYAIGPAGCGKTAYLAQWLEAAGGDRLYYQMDEQDREPRHFTAHLAAGLSRRWPGWNPPGADPAELAAELVSEAAARPPLTLVLDGAEHGFGQPWFYDLLEMLLRYGPQGFRLGVGSRAPLALDLPAVRAADLAFSGHEAAAWLGGAGGRWAGEGWEPVWAATGGYPLALALWQRHGPGWRGALAAHLRANLPHHVAPDLGGALVEHWLSGQIDLAALARTLAEGQPGAERLWAEVEAIRGALLQGDLAGARAQLDPLWERARVSGDRRLEGMAALLRGEWHYCRGEYAQAMEWYRTAFERDPLLETTGCHHQVQILTDQGHLAEADSLSRRMLEALEPRADLMALACAHTLRGHLLAELGRFDEAERHFREAERVGLHLGAEPFFGILAMLQRGLLYARQGNLAELRLTVEEAYSRARRRSPWLEAICAYVLAPGMLAWGERERAAALLAEARRFLEAIEAKFQLHMLHMIEGVQALMEGRQADVQAHVDTALSLAAREDYVQYFPGPGQWMLPLITGALVRGHEAPLCQRVLIRMGRDALPTLLELARSESPQARRAAIYPLAAIGGEEAVAAIASLLKDPVDEVSDPALMAWRTLGQTAPPPPAPAAAQRALPEGRLAIDLLGHVAVSWAGERLQSWRTVKARDLLLYLALQGDRPVSRGQILEALWPEAEPEAGQAVLHTTLYHLRRTIRPAGDDLILFAGGAYRLDQTRIALDLDRFYALAVGEQPADWRAAVSLYRGDALEGLDYPWCEPVRARARATYLDLLRRISAGLAPAQAVEWYQLLLQAEPLDESAHMGLMQAYAAMGNRSAALQQYRTLARLLDEELGLEPGEAAKQLYTHLLD